jgi:small redox-active disulfide protein 2
MNSLKPREALDRARETRKNPTSKNQEETVKVEILGVGCTKCHKLYDMVNGLVREKGLDAEVVKVEDIKVFADYGVFMTPALVVDGEVKLAGKLPKESDLTKWLSA